MSLICRDYRLLSGLIPPDLVSKGLFCALSHFRQKRIYFLERECFYFVIIKSFIVLCIVDMCVISCVYFYSYGLSSVRIACFVVTVQ